MIRRLICWLFGHGRCLDYDPSDDYKLVVVCYRCGAELETVREGRP